MQRWTNWARTVTAAPGSVVAPRDTTEAAEAIRAAARRGGTVRPLGAGHSFSGIGSPNTGCALDLSHWSGIVQATPDDGLVKVRAGTPLHQLNAELDGLGLALANLGDIDRQTIAGAIATGTHGTGAGLGGLATQIEELELLLADGTEKRCSATENPELFAAARVGLGALGVITTVTLRCVPAFALAADERPARLDDVLDGFDELAADNDHIEFYWFPHASKTLVKRNNRLPAGESPRPLHPLRHFLEYTVLENRLFGAVCRLGRAVPASVRPLNRFCASTWSTRSYSDRSYRVFTTRRDVRFVECEYAVPREALRDVLDELRIAVGRLADPVMFPVEVRVAAADDVWLSTAYRRPSAYIAVHQFQRMPYRRWFDTFEDIVGAVGGRPHWGKVHRLDASALHELYPRFDDFRRVRAEVDPGGVFRNPYLDRVLGPVDNSVDFKWKSTR
ncbi:D-arabinono-1,4-lactone oxidase [Saccharopolyspora phatthalungensis]|uniref:L-gulonolactone oxidase n=1 Tax=Saccharopolyspora phatthalungensis TaxID=664693 RepID=A0A840Q6H4_9PSEU|nr:D-arabinono-1,4-lactone oxidase [Saccharopolyspora phatthalungensis]MBB5154259.1 L-gulonolactone oxidase [Saccharopolyspora phatthalungensis]